MVKESKIFTVLMWPASGSYIVVLEEIPGVRLLLIWIGRNEAEAIVLKLQNTELPRPLTHDLLKTVVDQIGYKVDRVVINDLRNDTYYAKIVLRSDGSVIEIDSRPSDGIAIACRVNCGIFAAQEIMDQASADWSILTSQEDEADTDTETEDESEDEDQPDF